MLEPIRKAYYRKMAFRCILAILLGAVVTGLILYLSLSREPGSSYAESYAVMASLRSELFHESMAIYFATTLFTAIGIAVISLLFSHRVAGPAYRLGVFARKIASGDLSGSVKLRQHDEIDMLADDLNHLVAGYKNVIAGLESRTKEFEEIAAAVGERKGDAARDALAGLSAKRDEINKVLSNIKL
jgi:methyl-accepting chemotaxis protein